MPADTSRSDDPDNLSGQGWIAERTPEGCVLRWLTNHPTSRFVSVEAHAQITEAEFEHLRRHPEAGEALIRTYEPVQVIDYS
ncbi:hypothetical protein ACQEVB_28510 [Pseudonocardia sp. CA-107938]|uniref:hypothetical protein n=1 Tax=Pseudonocardia sp. CA-107938 TaxID=3240021 RepID=UPI003D8FC3E5